MLSQTELRIIGNGSGPRNHVRLPQLIRIRWPQASWGNFGSLVDMSEPHPKIAIDLVNLSRKVISRGC